MHALKIVAALSGQSMLVWVELSTIWRWQWISDDIRDYQWTPFPAIHCIYTYMCVCFCKIITYYLDTPHHGQTSVSADHWTGSYRRLKLHASHRSQEVDMNLQRVGLPRRSFEVPQYLWRLLAISEKGANPEKLAG